MFVGGLILSFIPFFGGLIAGIVGGKIAGTPGRAVTAALVPAILTGVVAALVSIHLPVLGIFLGAVAFVVAAFHFLGVLIGAFIGGNL
jgi:hypothetical protein